MAFCALYHATITQLQAGNVQNEQKKYLKKVEVCAHLRRFFWYYNNCKNPQYII